MSLLVDMTVTLSEREAQFVKEYIELRRARDPQHAAYVGESTLLATALMDGIREGIRLYGPKSKEAA